MDVQKVMVLTCQTQIFSLSNVYSQTEYSTFKLKINLLPVFIPIFNTLDITEHCILCQRMQGQCVVGHGFYFHHGLFFAMHVAN